MSSFGLLYLHLRGLFVSLCQGWTCFRVEQLEARLLSLDSLCASWLNEAARHEEKLRRDMLTCRLNDDINQVRELQSLAGLFKLVTVHSSGLSLPLKG